MSARQYLPCGLQCVAVLACLAFAPATSAAQDYPGKLTMGLYSTAHRSTVDVNARYSVRNWTGWLGWYGPDPGASQARAGLEYDIHRPRALVIPTLQVASRSLLG